MRLKLLALQPRLLGIDVILLAGSDGMKVGLLNIIIE